MNITIKPMIRLALMVLLMSFMLLPAHAFYNPTTGRWLSRDPVEENGGMNLQVYIQNNGLNGIDYLGLLFSSGNDDFPILAIDLGKTPPITLPGGTAGGLTKAIEWELLFKTVISGDQRGSKCSACTYQLIANGYARITFQWSSLLNRAHELVHVGLYFSNWDDMVSLIESLMSPCYSKYSKAICYKNTLPSIVQYYRDRAELENARFDCSSYGNTFGACTYVERHTGTLDNEEAQLRKQLETCDYIN